MASDVKVLFLGGVFGGFEGEGFDLGIVNLVFREVFGSINMVGFYWVVFGFLLLFD